MATRADIRAKIFGRKLKEEAVSLPEWGDNLVIRELSGKAGINLIKQCSDDKGKVDQDKLVPMIILSTLRNADESGNPLVFSDDNTPEVPNVAYCDPLMEGGLGDVMVVAQASIKLSGLNEAAAVDEAKKASGGTPESASHSS